MFNTKYSQRPTALNSIYSRPAYCSEDNPLSILQDQPADLLQYLAETLNLNLVCFCSLAILNLLNGDSAWDDSLKLVSFFAVGDYFGANGKGSSN